MSDGSPNPSTLSLDYEYGEFYFDNYYDTKTTYTVDVTVETTDGYNSEFITIEGFQISSVCGPGSTTLTAPDTTDIPDLYRITNYPEPLSATGVFTSSNSECEVVANTLT
jgi:hypothetical protein